MNTLKKAEAPTKPATALVVKTYKATDADYQNAMQYFRDKADGSTLAGYLAGEVKRLAEKQRAKKK